MNLTQDQHDLFFLITESASTHAQYEALCAEIEEAIDTTRPDDAKTDPYGLKPLAADQDLEPVMLEDAACVIAVAWLETIARAIADQEGEISRHLFDDDGISVFCDTRPLFDVAAACGIGPAHLRRALARTKRDAKTVSSRALKILGTTGVVRVPTRKSVLRRTDRKQRLAPCFARQLETGELARAKAGSITYTLTVNGLSYRAHRSRKVTVAPGRSLGADGLPVIGEANVDEISDFCSPFVACDESHGFAVDHFAAYLADKGYTYQRLVYRTNAA